MLKRHDICIDSLEVERNKQVSLALVKLGLKLDPVQPEGVEEGGQALHDHQDGDGQDGPEGKDDKEDNAARVALAKRGEGNLQDHLPQHL